jgi:hypothetical protein
MYPDRKGKHVVNPNNGVVRSRRVDRAKQGALADIWNHRDDLGLMEQLGVQVHAGAALDA